MKYSIIYGEPGRGKTTYIKKMISDSLYIENLKYFSGMSELEFLKRILDKIYGLLEYKTEYDIRSKFYNTLCNYEFVIIDNCELIDLDIFENIINQCISQNIQHIYLIFDVSKIDITKNEHYKFLLKNSDIASIKDEKEYIPNKTTFYEFIKKNYPKLKEESYPNLIKSCKYNFSNIKLFMGLKNNKNDEITDISHVDYINYINSWISSEFNKLPKESQEVLNQASIIGLEFQPEVLESSEGFKIFEVSSYLEELEKMNIFIKKYMENKNSYCFLSKEIHKSIYSNIAPVVKESWMNILVHYYENEIKKTNITADIELYIIQLLKLKELYSILQNKKKVFEINQHMLYIYQNNNDIKNTLCIITEMIDYVYENNLKELEHTLLILNLEILMKAGYFQESIVLIEKLQKIPVFFTESNYLMYYYASNLYNIGRVDESFQITLNLIKKLKETSATNNHEQPLYALVYSLYSTLQDHLDKDDGGVKYYRLAKNHAKNLKDQSILYNILKRCNTFYSYESSKKILNECITFYKQENRYLELGEIYFNLATEILFQEESGIHVKEYFKKCEDIFLCFANEKSAYIENNFAIYYILEENNVEKALSMLKRVCFTELSDFTKMTIYLNISMCHILLNQFETEEFIDIHNKFNQCIQRLMNRENSSKYEAIYKEILDIILLEHRGYTDQVIQTCSRILNTLDNKSFFKPIIQDIKNRNSTNLAVSYNENINFYTKINKNKIFLAEFRFWE